MVSARVAFLMNVCETHAEHSLSYGQVGFAKQAQKRAAPYKGLVKSGPSTAKNKLTGKKVPLALVFLVSKPLLTNRNHEINRS